MLDKTEQQNLLTSFVNQHGCEWIVIPPRAPHLGGLWEAEIKSMKRHMHRVIGLQTLTYEEILTVINQIEAVLISRPLFQLSNDPNDLAALTPANISSPVSQMVITRKSQPQHQKNC